ncbi:HAD-IA family hydrolase [Sphingomonas sp.]|jgi:phosphoglycolate phosphatase|uniref:HAD-IA family hydrolase n=1 Tax=Sphingomonas sp. TaxID=28214 RepID=UPI0026040DDA|nr:HAD-IA family hydrolase [Sphingomonas sp.]MDF2493193.1 phosphoglycolate phosphatase, bacterial [Sphingomonas sp.]
MQPFHFDTVGFDLDGTLIDTSGDLAAAVNYALAQDGRSPLSVEAIKPMIGGGARHMLAQGLAATGGGDDALLDRLHQVLLTYYEANIYVHSVPFPGAVQALDDLAARGAKVAVVTNKLERFALEVLRDAELLDRLTCVIGGDTLGPGKSKPAPDPIQEMIRRAGGGTAAFVGDSIYDVAAAHAARIPAVACRFGFLMQPVEELGADAIIDHFDELVPVLDKLS